MGSQAQKDSKFPRSLFYIVYARKRQITHEFNIYKFVFVSFAMFCVTLVLKTVTYKSKLLGFQQFFANAQEIANAKFEYR